MSSDDRCPRCGGAFHCGVNDDLPCACTQARLTAELRAALAERYTGCLCMRCLAELSQQEQTALPAEPPGGGAAPAPR